MLAERPDLRLFVALWPDGDLGARIAQAARAAIGDGRAVPAERLHLTLAFIGRLPADRLDACSQALGTVRGGSFDLCLDRFGFWRRNGILWLGMREPGAHCAQQLAALVTGALQPDRGPEVSPARVDEPTSGDRLEGVALAIDRVHTGSRRLCVSCQS